MNHTMPMPAAAIHLSAREREVLQVLSTGEPVKRVAARLGISSHTVNQHVRQIYLKLSVNNRILALNRARQLGLLTIQ